MYTADFSEGHEDLELDGTQLVEEWILGNAGGITEIKDNYGFGVFFTSSYEAHTTASDKYVLHNPDGQKKSFYTKRFFSRTSQFFFKRPVLEARWDSRITDDRGNFYASSSLAPASDNLNNLYLYNYVRGDLRNIPGDAQNGETIQVKLYLKDDNKPTGNALATATATRSSTGVYKAQISIDTTSSFLYDVWSGSEGGEYKTGSINVRKFENDSGLLANDYKNYVTKITNLKSSYAKDETATFRVFTRPRNYNFNIYTTATSTPEGTLVPSASFQVVRVVDGKTMFNHSTSSTDYHTFLSYDNSGSYFDFDMSLLEPGYMYGIKLAFSISGDWRVQPEVFKFRVEDN